MYISFPTPTINPSHNNPIVDALAELYIYQDFYRAPFTQQHQFRAWCTSRGNPFRKEVAHYSNHLLHALYGSIKDWQDALGQYPEDFSIFKLEKIFTQRPALVDNIIKKGMFFNHAIHSKDCINSIIEQWYANNPQFIQACNARKSKVRKSNTAPLGPSLTSYVKYLRLYLLSPEHYKKPFLASASDLYDCIRIFTRVSFTRHKGQLLAELAQTQKYLQAVLDGPEITSFKITRVELEQLKQLSHDLAHQGSFDLPAAFSSHAVISQTCQRLSLALYQNRGISSGVENTLDRGSPKVLSLEALHKNLVSIIRSPSLIKTAELYTAGKVFDQMHVFNLYDLSRVTHESEISSRIDEIYPDNLYKIKSEYLNLFSSEMCGNTSKHLMKVAANASGEISIDDSHLNEKAFIDTGYYEVMDNDVELQLVRLAREAKPSIMHLNMSLFGHDLILVCNERGQAMILQSNTYDGIAPCFNLMQWLKKEPAIFKLEKFADDLLALKKVLQGGDKEAVIKRVHLFAKQYLQAVPTKTFDYSRAHALTLRRFKLEFKAEGFCQELTRLKERAITLTQESKNLFQPQLVCLKRDILKAARAQFYSVFKQLKSSVGEYKKAYALLPKAEQSSNQQSYANGLKAATILENKLNKLIAVAIVKTDSFKHLEKDLDSVVDGISVLKDNTQSLVLGTQPCQTKACRNPMNSL